MLKQISSKKWLLCILLIIVFTLVGWGISTWIDNFIPLWLLLGFSVIFSIQKWFIYYTRKYKIVGKIYRLVLNLSILSLLGLIIWTGISLFTERLDENPLIGSLVFLAEIIVFIWLFRVVSKNSWRWPSMKLTAFSLACLFVIFAFAGVKPMAGYKDDAIGRVTAFFNEQKDKATTKLEQDNNEKDSVSKEVVINKSTITTNSNFVSKAVDVVDDLWETDVDDYADKFNQYRQSKVFTALEFTDDLNRVAELRLKELYKDYSHNSAGNYNEHLAENIAMSTGSLSNSDALRMWQNSPGHNANMLDGGYKYTGYAIGNGYAVQVFTEYPTINGEPQLPPGWYWLD